MISSREATAGLEKCRADLGLPSEARLILLEKRLIELGDSGEIEPVAPIQSLLEDAEVETGGTGSAQEESENRDPVFSNRTVWIGTYSHSMSTWELALDENGTLVRLRKSR